MNKLMAKIVGMVAGIAMVASGMGATIANNSKEAKPIFATTTYEQLTSIASIDETASYVLGVDGTGFHYEGTSSWGKTALPSAHNPILYTLKKANDEQSFTAEATISSTKYYLQIPTSSNTFSMATTSGTNTDIIIGTTQVSGTNYAVTNKTTTARHLRINGTSGLRSYASTTGTMAFFYKVATSGGSGSSSSSSNSSSSSSSSTQAKYTVTYNANGATGGTVPIDETEYTSGSEVTVLGNTGNLVKNGYNFNGWTDGNNNYAADETFNITTNITLTAIWTEDVDAGASTYLLKDMSNFKNWGNSYSNHSHTFTVSQNETAVVSIAGGSKQTSTITDVPVTKGGDVTFVLNSDARYIKNVTFHARQWSEKAQTMTLHTSINGGASYTNTEISTNYFLIRGKNFASGTNAVKITFSSSSNQVGCVDFVVTYDNLPSVEATSMSFSPSTLSLFGEEEGTFTPSLSGGTGNYEKTIVWTSSHPSIIAAPANSEAGVAVNITPQRVLSNTDVTITGTVDVAGGASASIVVTVKVIKTISVDHVDISGIENNITLDGSTDSSIDVHKTIQLSANVTYNQGDAYMDGNNGITWSSNNASVASVDSTGLVLLRGNGTVTITATSTEDENKSASLTFTVSNIVGIESNPYSVAQARSAIDTLAANGTIANAHVRGIISRIDSISSGAITYYVSDDGSTTDQLRVYKGKGINGANFSSKDDIEIGATVLVTGTLSKYNTDYQFNQGSNLVTYTEPTKEFKINTYLSNSSSNVTTINGDEHRTSNINGESIVFADLDLDNGASCSDPFDGGHFTISFSGGSNPSKYYDDGSAVRVYGGGVITIASSSEQTINEIKFVWSGNYKPEAANVASVSTYNVTKAVWSGSSTSVALTRPTGSGQWRLQSVTVYYGTVDRVDNLAVRLGASIPKTTWDAINAIENCEITDYGVMVFKTKAQYAESAPSPKTLYDTNPAYVENFHKGSGDAPTAIDGRYTFTGRIDFPNNDNSEHNMYLIAQAYIIVNGTDFYPVGEIMRKSVKSLAVDNTSTNLSSGALAFLA